MQACRHSPETPLIFHSPMETPRHGAPVPTLCCPKDLLRSLWDTERKTIRKPALPTNIAQKVRFSLILFGGNHTHTHLPKQNLVDVDPSAKVFRFVGPMYNPTCFISKQVKVQGSATKCSSSIICLPHSLTFIFKPKKHMLN